MTTLTTGRPGPVSASVEECRRLLVERRWLAHAAVAGFTAVMAVLTYRWGPGPRALTVTVLALAAVAVLWRPAVGIYVCGFFSLLGDGQLAWWYPFVKNLSSHESALYVHNALFVSPLEVFIGITALSWLARVFGGGRLVWHRGRLAGPLAAFSVAMLVGLLTGLARGGDANVALWEIRPMLYVPALYVLATVLFTSTRQYVRLTWFLVAALALEAVHAQYVISSMSDATAASAHLMGYLEHSASLHFNTVFVLLGASLLHRGTPWTSRLLLAVAAVPLVGVYLAAERRSAVVALVAGMILLAIVLLRERRAAFWLVVPCVVVVGAVYVAAFWNVQSGLGFPAQAVKSVVAPSQLDAANSSSDFYRQIETYNIVATIRSNVLLGTGFGHRVYEIYPLPYVAFPWAGYLTHNSLLWIWTNTGVAGFVATLYLLARAVVVGVRATSRVRPAEATVTLGATIFVIMYVIYTYVDISWDAQSMVYLGLALALIDNIARLGGGRPTDTATPGATAAAPRTDQQTGATTRG